MADLYYQYQDQYLLNMFFSSFTHSRMYSRVTPSSYKIDEEVQAVQGKVPILIIFSISS